MVFFERNGLAKLLRQNARASKKKIASLGAFKGRGTGNRRVRPENQTPSPLLEAFRVCHHGGMTSVMLGPDDGLKK